jgi:hypothetical protein
VASYEQGNVKFLATLRCSKFHRFATALRASKTVPRTVLTEPVFSIPQHPIKTKKALYRAFLVLERVMGIEPTLFAWEARVLPLNDTRQCFSLAHHGS